MSRPIEDLEQEVLLLPVAEKERLVRLLLDDLDGPPDPAVSRAWLEEIQRRSDDYDAGRMEAIDADAALAAVRGRVAEK